MCLCEDGNFSSFHIFNYSLRFGEANLGFDVQFRRVVPNVVWDFAPGTLDIRKGTVFSLVISFSGIDIFYEDCNVLILIKMDDFPVSVNLFGVNDDVSGMRCRASDFDGESVIE